MVRGALETSVFEPRYGQAAVPPVTAAARSFGAFGRVRGGAIAAVLSLLLHIVLVGALMDGGRGASKPPVEARPGVRSTDSRDDTALQWVVLEETPSNDAPTLFAREIVIQVPKFTFPAIPKIHPPDENNAEQARQAGPQGDE